MTDDELRRKIAALGCRAGISASYQDNFGGRHRTSQATYRALLTAMGVSWEDPASLEQELARRRLGPWNSLLEPVELTFPAQGAGKVILRAWAPSAQPSCAYEMHVELTGEDGVRHSWETALLPEPGAQVRAVPDGFRITLTLNLPEGLELGYYDLTVGAHGNGRRETGRTRLIAAPQQAYDPPWLRAGRRLWGFNVPLYALQSETNWGIGDFGTLSEMVRWAGSLGAAFVGVNPLHAPGGHEHPDPSPYSPTSRIFLNMLYLDLEAVPELEHCREAQALLAGPEFQADRERLRQAPFISHREVCYWKRRVLGLLHRTFEDLHGPPEAPLTPRSRDFAHYLARRGDLLEKFGQFCALADFFRDGNWRCWPENYQDPDNPAVVAFSREHRRDLRLHQYAQWLAEEQLTDVCREARGQKMPLTLYEDLALGASAGGFDTWAQRDLFALNASLGAPPDAFNPKGQNWGLPPLIPERLRQAGYQPFIDTLRANAPPDGMLRLDHVMSLFRLLWIPQGMAAGEGAYVNYPARELLAVLALESARRRTLIIGEDLGTVPRYIRRDLARANVLSYKVFYFERDWEHRFLAPERYPARAMATVTTHDLPTLAGFWEGRDLTLKHDLDLYPDAQLAQIDAVDRERDRKLLLEALEGQDLLKTEAVSGNSLPANCPPQVRQGVLEYLARTPAALLEVRLEEILGVAEQQNLPGTINEHPNWRRRLPFTIQEMAQQPEPGQIAVRLNKYRSRE